MLANSPLKSGTMLLDTHNHYGCYILKRLSAGDSLTVANTSSTQQTARLSGGKPTQPNPTTTTQLWSNTNYRRHQPGR